MAKYRKIDPRIWNDAKFSGFSDKAKLAFLFLLTHPHMTSLGAMRATLPGLAAELGWSAEAFGEAFREAFSKGLVKHDERVSFIWLPNFLKYNGPESPNVITAWGKCADLIPECKMKDELLQHVKGFVEGLGEGFRKAFAKSMPYQEQEQEQEQELNKPPNPRDGGTAGEGTNSGQPGSSPKKSPKKTSDSFDPMSVPIPASLECPEFSASWQMWCEHRKQKRKPMTEHSVRLQLKDLETYGTETAIRIIEFTVRKGWEGLAEPHQLLGPATTSGLIQPRNLLSTIDDMQDPRIPKEESRAECFEARRV